MSRYDDETKRISDRISEIGAEAYQQEVKAQQQGGPYNLRLRGKAWQELTVEGKAELLNGLTTQELESYAFDSRCNQSAECGMALGKRSDTRATRLQANPFDPRTEISADASFISGRIVKHLWIIFVILPFVLAVLYNILK